jgi:hypothetical protein
MAHEESFERELELLREDIRRLNDRRERHARLAVTEVLNLPPEDAVDALAMRALSLRLDPSVDWATVAPGLKLVYEIWCLQGEVPNGTMQSWFESMVWDEWHPSDVTEVVSYLRLLGAEAQARAVERGAELLPGWHEESASAPELYEVLSRGQPFETSPNLLELLERYVREHPEAFATDGASADP